MADKIQDFTQLIAGLMTKTIIAANQNKPFPAYPFIIYQSISSNRDNLSVVDSVAINGLLDVEEIKTRRVEEVIQFDVYAEDHLSANEEINNLIDSIEYTYRREILEAVWPRRRLSAGCVRYPGLPPVWQFGCAARRGGGR